MGRTLEISGNFTYTNCGSCTATETSKEAIIKVLKLGHELADITGEGEVHVVCSSSLDCTYKGEGLVGDALGPLLAEAENGEVRIERQEVKKVAGGFLCPKNSKLDLLTTPLSATYVAEGQTGESTVLCGQDPEAGEEALCALGGLIVECDVLFLGDVKSTNSLGAPLKLTGNFTYTNCGSCEVTETSKSSEIEVLKLGHELADVTGEGKVHVVCGSSLDCTYKGENLVGHALGPLLVEAGGSENGEIRLEGQETKKVAGGLLCPKTSKLDLLTHPLTTTYITE